MALKVAVVTSRVTYIKQNYSLLFRELYKRSPENIAGVILLSNYDKSLLKGIVGCLYLGAYRLFWALIRNTISSLLPLFDSRVVGARKLNIPVRYFKSANDVAFVNWVKENDIDLVVNARTRCIYRQAILDAPKYGCVNIHHGLLPEYRGTMCDLYALYENRPAGFSIHRMNKKIDDGEIIQVVPVSHNIFNYPNHLLRSSAIEGETLASLIHDIGRANGFPSLIPNTTKNKTYTKNPTSTLVRKMKQKGMKL